MAAMDMKVVEQKHNLDADPSAGDAAYEGGKLFIVANQKGISSKCNWSYSLANFKAEGMAKSLLLPLYG